MSTLHAQLLPYFSRGNNLAITNLRLSPAVPPTFLLLLGNFPRIADPTQPSTTFPLNQTNLHSLSRLSLAAFQSTQRPTTGGMSLENGESGGRSPVELRLVKRVAIKPLQGVASEVKTLPNQPQTNKSFKTKQGPRKKGVREVKLFRARMHRHETCNPRQKKKKKLQLPLRHTQASESTARDRDGEVNAPTEQAHTPQKMRGKARQGRVLTACSAPCDPRERFNDLTETKPMASADTRMDATASNSNGKGKRCAPTHLPTHLNF